MRAALEYFYRLRGLQSKADIAEFELKCIENGDKLVTLQSDMMRVIEHINRFLEANNAAHDVISMEAAKIAQTPTSGTMVAWNHDFTNITSEKMDCKKEERTWTNI